MTVIFILIASLLIIGIAGSVILYLFRGRWLKKEEFDATKDLFI